MSTDPDIPWAEEPPDRRRAMARLLRGSLGLGLVAGAVEGVFIASDSQLVLPADEAAVLGAVACLLGGILGCGIGLIFATLGIRTLRDASGTVRWLAFMLGMVAGAIGAWHVWPAGFVLATEQERFAASLSFFFAPMALSGVVLMNSRFFLKRHAHREAEGMPLGMGFLPWSVGLSALLVLLGSVLASGKTYGTAKALDTDASVLLITVDSLRRDHVSTYGGAAASTPAMDELANGGILFENAITPMTATAPAHAAIFTGIHPVRLGMDEDGVRLARRYRTLAETLADEGYATAAFVSTVALDHRTGLGQGFQAYDDDFMPGVRGLGQTRLGGIILELLVEYGDPLWLRPLLQRSAEETAGRAVAWLRSIGSRPFFLWIHLDEPHPPYSKRGPSDVDHAALLAAQTELDPTTVEVLKKQYRGEVEHVDTVLGDFLDAVSTVVDRPTSILLTADYGQMLGEHDSFFTHEGIHESAIRIPLIIRPHTGSFSVNRVGPQVRLMDLTNTVLALLRMDSLEGTESGNLLGFAQGLHDRDFASLLAGSTEEGPVYGFRAAQKDEGGTGSMLKYHWNPRTDVHQLFDLGADPFERRNLAVSQPSVLSTLRARVQGEVRTAQARN